MTVDPTGNLFFTVDGERSLRKISAKTLTALEKGVSVSKVDELLYDSSSSNFISNIVGVVSDGTRIYWANSNAAGSNASIASGDGIPNRQPLIANTRVVTPPTFSPHGITKTHSYIFYSAYEPNHIGISEQWPGKLYGVKITGGTPIALAGGFDYPQGLSWDGDGTVYVADSKAGLVWSVPCSRLAEVDSSPVVKMTDATGLAILSFTSAAVPQGVLGTLLLLATLHLWARY